jgi:uncharacterized protein (TIGR03435 family)
MTAAVTTAQTPSFEVASIKKNTSRPSGPDARMLGCHGTNSHSPLMTIPLGRCATRFEPLRLVIALAYDIPPSLLYPYDGKILSGPEWINSEIYDIEAKAEGPTTEAQLKLMLQDLLADRFKLKLHRESREMPVYALVTTKGGIKFPAAPKDRECGEQVRRDHRYELGATSLAGQCHGFVPDRGALTGQSVNMSDFAEMLSIWAGRVVIDKTGADGLFDIKMPPVISALQDLVAVERKESAIAGARGDAGGPGGRVAVDSRPTVFNALDQFGLKLESTKGPVDVLVIDSIQKPSEN